MRLLVLDSAGLGVPERAISSIEAVDEPSSHASSSPPARPWLPGLVGRAVSQDAGGSRRALHLSNGGWVEVPGEMRIVDGVEVLALPDLLRPIGESAGIVGLAALADELLLVCDPNLLTEAGGGSAT